jgi:thiol-disulfide isomerase/thioredoxin
VPKPVPAPDFTLADMDEQMHSFKDLRGKVVLLNFWATWCPPCRREMPSMERLYQKLNGEDFTVIAVNQMETGDHVFAYTGQLAVDPTFTILFDRDSRVSNSYRVNGLPTTYLIDKQGNIRFRAIGGREFDHPDVEKQILQLMNE